MAIEFVTVTSSRAVGSPEVEFLSLWPAISIGDLLLVTINSDTATLVSTPDDSWTSLSSSPSTVDGDGTIRIRVYTFYKIATQVDTEDATVYPFTFSSGLPLGVLVGFSGTDVETPISVAGVSAKVDDSAPWGDLIAAGVTVPTPGSVALTVFASFGLKLYSSSNAGSQIAGLSHGTNDKGIDLWSELIANPQTLADRTATASGGLATDGNTAFMFLLSPPIIAGIGNGIPMPNAPLRLSRPIIIPLRQNFCVLAEFFPVGSENILDLINSGADDDSKTIEVHLEGDLTREVL